MTDRRPDEPRREGLDVSVVLCTFNGASFIEEQVRSILRQTRPVQQIVLSDDGSTDNTVAAARSVVDGWPGDRPILTVVVNETRRGLRANVEQAIGMADGHLIALCDQDDVWHSDRVAAAVDDFERDPGTVLRHTDADLVDRNGRSLGMSLFEALEVSAKDIELENAGSAFAVLLRRNIVTGATTFVRADAARAALPIPNGWVHDEWLAIFTAATGRIRCEPTPSIDYRQHGANQIGVSAPTLRRKIGRVLTTTGERNHVLAEKFEQLAERLAAEHGVSRRSLDEAREKARFESRRAGLPDRRLVRLPPLLALARTGSYSRFASRGRADIVRDMVRSR